MNNATIFIKTEPKIKAEAQKTARELGFSLSSILNGFLRQFVKTRTITFSAKELDEIPNAKTRRLLKQSEEDVKAGRVISFKNTQEVLEYLDKEILNEKQST